MSEIHRTADQDTLRTVLEMCAELKVKNERLRKEVLVLEAELEAVRGSVDRMNRIENLRLMRLSDSEGER